MTKPVIQYLPAVYAETAVVAKEVSEQMLAQLDWMTIKPQVIVDLGCGIGYSADLLKKRYPNAALMGIDCTEAMLDYARNHQDQDIRWICADAGILPLADQSVDLIFANLLLPWVDNLKQLLFECRRILRPESLFIFSSLGPDTLNEIRECSSDSIMPDLIDMHYIGDELIDSRFVDPVLNVDHLTVEYREVKTLFYELEQTGMIEKNVPLTIFEKKEEGAISLTYEIIYGHAWSSSEIENQIPDENGAVKIPLASLRRSLSKL